MLQRNPSGSLSGGGTAVIRDAGGPPGAPFQYQGTGFGEPGVEDDEGVALAVNNAEHLVRLLGGEVAGFRNRSAGETIGQRRIAKKSMRVLPAGLSIAAAVSVLRQACQQQDAPTSP